MDGEDFKAFANKMAEYITTYVDTARDRDVTPSVQPGYLRPLLPSEAPESAERWEDVMSDVERLITPGMTNWTSPNFHAFFPMGSSYPSIVADMLSDAYGCAGLNWAAAPACTELEAITLDWLGKSLGLPDEFLFSSRGKGGGVVQGSGSDSNLIALLAAKVKYVKLTKEKNPSMSEDDIVARLIGYSSDQAHSSVPKAGLVAGIKIRLLQSDECRKLRRNTLIEAIHADRKAGLIPFFVTATLGTTPSCAFDDLNEIGDVTHQEDLWLHVDSAYAGSMFLCPEYRHLLGGIDKCDTFMMNPHKWLLVNADFAVIWFRDPTWMIDGLTVKSAYLKSATVNDLPEFRHWHVALTRRFRSLKLWFVLRLYGLERLRAYIRNHVMLAHRFEALCEADERFEVVEKVATGLVCFRLKAPNDVNEALLDKINSRRKIFMVPAMIHGKVCLRFCVCSERSEERDVDFAWKEIIESLLEIQNERK